MIKYFIYDCAIGWMKVKWILFLGFEDHTSKSEC